MSQTDYVRRRHCVPPPSVKGQRSVFPRRIAGEAVFSPFSKPIRKRIQVRRPLHPLQLHTNCPRNSRVGVDCQEWSARTTPEPRSPQFARGCGLPGRTPPWAGRARPRNSRVGVDCQHSVNQSINALVTRNSRVGVDCQSEITEISRIASPAIRTWISSFRASSDTQKAQPYSKVVLFVLYLTEYPSHRKA